MAEDVHDAQVKKETAGVIVPQKTRQRSKLMKEAYEPQTNVASKEVVAVPCERQLLFVHSVVDELRLSPVQFRVYAHMSRRGKLTASPKTTAELCCIDEDTFWRAAADLERFGMVRRHRRPGSTSVFEVTAENEWNLGAIQNRPRRCRKATPTGISGAPELAGHPAKSGDVTGNNGATGGGLNGVTPTGISGVERRSHKGDPRKEIQKSNPEQFDLRSLLDSSNKSDEFKTAFRQWVEYRNQGPKSKRLSEISIKTLWEKWSKRPETDFIEGVENSISNGWQGLFEPKRSFATPRLQHQKVPDHSKGF